MKYVSTIAKLFKYILMFMHFFQYRARELYTIQTYEGTDSYPEFDHSLNFSIVYRCDFYFISRSCYEANMFISEIFNMNIVNGYS
jgi:hypothetical protein